MKEPVVKNKPAAEKGIFCKLSADTYKKLRAKYPDCSDAQKAVQAIEELLGTKQPIKEYKKHRIYTMIHGAGGYRVPNLNRSQVAKIMKMERRTLQRRMDKAKSLGLTGYTQGEWTVELT